MALIFVEGFDKYGPVNSNNTGVNTMLTAGEWTSVTGAGLSIVAGLSAAGQALNILGASGPIKTLSASYSRLIGGVRFSSALSGNPAGIQFYDAGTQQAGIRIETTGIIRMVNGVFNTGTILGSASSPITANTTHYLEWDVTFGNSAAYSIYLDGVSVISGTGDTTATANSTANGFQFSGNTGANWTVDDFYLFDATGTTNNAVLLTSPRVETSFPTSDSAVQFGFGAGIVGTAVSRNATSQTIGVNNQMRLRPVIPAVNCTIQSVSISPVATNASINLRPVIYTDSAGLPNALMSAGATVTGMTSGAIRTMPLTTPQALTAGTQYWVGFMADVTLTNCLAGLDGTNTDRTQTATFASGAPGTASGTAAAVSSVIFGNVTGSGNWYESAQQPPPGIQSYVLDATVNHEDLYNMTALSLPPAQIYAVAVKAYVAKSDAGAKTVSMRMKSGSTDSGGSATGQAMGTSFAWLTSLFERDPNGNIAWTGANLNAAQCGFKVDS